LFGSWKNAGFAKYFYPYEYFSPMGKNSAFSKQSTSNYKEAKLVCVLSGNPSQNSHYIIASFTQIYFKYI